MSRVQSVPKIRSGTKALHALLLAAGAAVIVAPAAAQQAPASGNVAEGAIASPAYVPVSAGAVAEPPVSGDASASFDDAQPEPARPARRTRQGESTDPGTTGTVRAGTVDSEVDLTVDKGAEREPAIESRNRVRDDRPFDAVGLRLGTFILKPTLETGLTATSNASNSAGGGSALLSETTLRLNGASDWSSGSATVNGYGTFRESLSGQDLSDAEGGIDAELIRELGKDYRARATFGLVVSPESAESPVVIPDVTSQPLHTAVSGSLGVEKAVGKARFGVTGVVESDTYGDADLADGTTLSQRDRDSTLYALRLRAGYEVSLALTPFIETEIGRRDYARDTDAAGYARSSDQLGARAGLAFDFGEKLTGEFSAGWLRESFDDSRLGDISAPSLDASVTWSPMRGTIVGLAASTLLEGSTTPGQSGSVLYTGRLTAEREIRANLSANAALGLGWRDYSGTDAHERIFNAEAGLTWWLNRYLGVSGRVRHESVDSNLAGRDSETNSIFVGMKLQR